MTLVIDSHRDGFAPGFTVITTYAEPDPTGIAFGVLKLARGESWQRVLEEETAFLLMSGDVTMRAGSAGERFRRASLFDESPSCLHAARGTAHGTQHEARGTARSTRPEARRTGRGTRNEEPGGT